MLKKTKSKAKSKTKSKASVSYIPDWVKFLLWGKSAGRCHYCNKLILLDSHTSAEFNAAYIAHIIADKPKGPRGHPVLSEKLKADLSNLMLLCDVHHRLIDKVDIRGHPVKRLRAMKAEHESRTELQTSLGTDCSSHIILYGANIGNHSSPLNWKNAYDAIAPKKYPAENRAIELGFKNSANSDRDADYWTTEKKNLNKLFGTFVKPRLTAHEISHLSVFALAPQPLLIELGKLISDINDADVYQLHREPRTWKWLATTNDPLYKIIKPAGTKKRVALNLSLSASIDNSRIESVLGTDISIWTFTIDSPSNDYLKTASQLSSFRIEIRKLLNEIKLEHGSDAELNIFPAVPVSAAVELGRVWMPKADLEMNLYDENRTKGGFSFAFKLQAD